MYYGALGTTFAPFGLLVPRAWLKSSKLWSVAALKNPRHELFAQHRAKGDTQQESAIAAGFKESDAASRGSKLDKRPEIVSRVRELRPRMAQVVTEKIALVTGISKRDIIRELWALKDRAIEEKQYQVARGCLTDIGKELFQMFSERKEVKFGWDGDPQKLTDDQMVELMYYLERQAIGEEAALHKKEERKQLLAAEMIVDVTPEKVEEPEGGAAPAAVQEGMDW
jgi:hypothetical protein